MKITYYISIGMIALAMLLGGCDKRNDVERKDLSFLGMNQNEVFDPVKYPYLSAFTGNMTGNDLLTILDTGMKILNESQRLGYTSSSDYQAMLGIMTHLRDTMAQEMTTEALDTTLVADLSALLAIMAGEDPLYPDCQLGATLDQLVRKAGPDVLSNEVTAMLTYLVAMDTTTLKNAVSGLSIADIKEHPEAFETLMTKVNGLLDPGPTGRYNALYEGLIDYGGSNGIIDQLGAVSGSEITLGDLKPVLDALQAIDFSSSGFLAAETETALDNAITAVEKIIDGRASSLEQADVENIAGLLYKLVAWMNNSGDSSIDPEVIRDTLTEIIDLLATDASVRQELSSMLFALAELLHSDDMPLILADLHDRVLHEGAVTDDKKLRTLLDEVLKSLPSISDSDIHLPHECTDILGLIGNDPTGYEDADKALFDYLIKRNQYGYDRSVTGGESAFVSLLKAMQNADFPARMGVVALMIPIQIDALSIVYPRYWNGTSYQTATKDNTLDIADFLASEIVRAIKFRYGGGEYNPSMGGAPKLGHDADRVKNADYNDDGVVDPNEAMYWLLWHKTYHLQYDLIISFQKDYNGVARFAFMRVQDLTALITSPAGNPYGLDLAPPPNALSVSAVNAGMIRDYVPALAALSGWNYEVKTSNGHVTEVNPLSDPTNDDDPPNHRLINVMWPLMDYFWNENQADNRIYMLVDLLKTILDTSSLISDDGLTLANNATTATVLQNVEGPNGDGLLTMAIRPHDADPYGILHGGLPFIANVISRLNNQPFGDGTILSAIADDMNTELISWVSGYGSGDTDLRFVNKLEETLFELDDQGTTAMQRLELFVSQNQGPLADLCVALGDLMTKGNDLDPLVDYAVSGAFFANLQTIWDNGNTWDKLQADIDDINLQIQTISGNTGFDFMTELQASLADLRDLHTTPADIGSRPVTAMLRHLLTPSGGASHYNPFVDGLLSLTCKTLDLYDENYNPGAVISPTGITADTTVVEAVQRVTGTYDLLPLQNLLFALTEKQTDEGELLLFKLLSDLSTFSDEAFGDEELPMSIVQSLFREVDVRGTPTSAVAVVMDQIYPGMVLVHSGGLSFQDVIGDTNRLFGGLDMQPNGEVYTTLFQALDFVVQNVRVQQ